MKLGNRIVLHNRLFIVRGVDPMSVAAPRVYLEDAETGEMLVDLLASVHNSSEGDCREDDQPSE